MRAPGTLTLWLFALALPLRCAVAAAQLTDLPRSLADEALAEDVPTAFAPTDFAVEDFAVDRVSGDAAITARLVPGSLRWVRVARHLVVPRALLLVEHAGARGGAVSYGGFSQPLSAADGGAGGARAQVPVVLLGGAQAITVRARPGAAAPDRAAPGHESAAAVFALRFAPRLGRGGRVLLDSNCSPYGVHVAAGSLPHDSWMYIGCRLIRTAREHDTAATLELYALWDQAGEVAVDGVPAAPVIPSLWTLRVAARPGRVRLSARGHALVLAAMLPDPLHAAFVGLGIGPYYYAYRDGAVELDTTVPLLTLYGGYAFTPEVRLVYFNATAMHPRWGSIDQGLYVWLEQAKMVDDRLSLNLLLGANVLVYSHDGHAVGRLSVPQGFEFIVRDLPVRNRNLTLGAFLYPKIAGRAYYNVWLRWGSPQLFGELNYIEWQETDGSERTHSRAFGVSFGTPILRFL